MSLPQRVLTVSLPGQAARWSVFMMILIYIALCLAQNFIPPCQINTGKRLDNKNKYLELDNSVAFTMSLWSPALGMKVPRQKVLNIPAAGASWLELAQAAAGEMCLEVFAGRCE